MLIMFATQVMFDLYARSAVTSVALEAARSVAGFSSSVAYGGGVAGGMNLDEQQAITTAEDRARSELGRYGSVTTFAWRFLPSDAAPTEVQLEVRFDASSSGFELTRPLALPHLDRFDRTIRVRVEHIVCAAPSCTLLGSGP